MYCQHVMSMLHVQQRLAGVLSGHSVRAFPVRNGICAMTCAEAMKIGLWLICLWSWSRTIMWDDSSATTTGNLGQPHDETSLAGAVWDTRV